MDNEHKPRKLLIVTGTAPEIEEQLNKLLNDYSAIIWSFVPVGSELHGAVVLLHSSVAQRQVHVPSSRMQPI